VNRLTHEQVREVRKKCRQIEAVRQSAGDDEGAKKLRDLGDIYQQLEETMESLAALRGLQIWRKAEEVMAEGKGREGLLLVMVPRGAARGAGVATFDLQQVAQGMVLAETRLRYFGEIAVGAYGVAVDMAIAGPKFENGEQS